MPSIYELLHDNYTCCCHLHSIHTQLNKEKKHAYFVTSALTKDTGSEGGKSWMYLAGLWTTAQGKDGEDEKRCVVLTTSSAQQPFAAIHERMPVLLPSLDAAMQWMNCDSYQIEDLAAYLHPFDNQLEWYEVSDHVNSVKNKKKRCVESLEDAKKRIKKDGIGRFFTAAAAAATPTAVKAEPAASDTNEKKVAVVKKEMKNAVVTHVPTKSAVAGFFDKKKPKKKHKDETTTPTNPPKRKDPPAGASSAKKKKKKKKGSIASFFSPSKKAS